MQRDKTESRHRDERAERRPQRRESERAHTDRYNSLDRVLGRQNIFLVLIFVTLNQHFFTYTLSVYGFKRRALCLTGTDLNTRASEAPDREVSPELIRANGPKAVAYAWCSVLSLFPVACSLAKRR